MCYIKGVGQAEYGSHKKNNLNLKNGSPLLPVLLFCHHPIIGQRSSYKMMIAWVKDLLRFRRTLTKIRTCVYDVRSNEQTHMCQRHMFENVQMYVLILLRFACHTRGSSTLPSPCLLRKCIRV